MWLWEHLWLIWKIPAGGESSLLGQLRLGCTQRSCLGSCFLDEPILNTPMQHLFSPSNQRV